MYLSWRVPGQIRNDVIGLFYVMSIVSIPNTKRGIGLTVADLGFHEGGFVRSGAAAEIFCKPRPLPAKTPALLRS